MYIYIYFLTLMRDFIRQSVVEVDLEVESSGWLKIQIDRAIQIDWGINQKTFRMK